MYRADGSDIPLPVAMTSSMFNRIWKLEYHMYNMQSVQVRYNQEHEQMESVEHNHAIAPIFAL